MIREITDADIPVLLSHGSAFWEVTPYVSTGMEYNPEAVSQLIETLREDHYLRVAEADGEIVGFIGLLIAPFVFNPNYTVATELFFYVHPLNRGSVGSQLIAQAEQDVKEIADLLSFGEMRSSKDMNDYYTRLGFVHSETTFVKVI